MYCTGNEPARRRKASTLATETCPVVSSLGACSARQSGLQVRNLLPRPSGVLRKGLGTRLARQFDSLGGGGGGGEGGGGVGTHNIFGWGFAARSWKPLPYFRPKYRNFQTLFQTWLSKCIPYFRPCDLWRIRQLSLVLRCTGLRDATNDARVFFSSRSMHTATHVTLKMVSHDQRDGTYPPFQTKMAKSIPYFRLEMLENGTPPRGGMGGGGGGCRGQFQRWPYWKWLAPRSCGLFSPWRWTFRRGNWRQSYNGATLRHLHVEFYN